MPGLAGEGGVNHSKYEIHFFQYKEGQIDILKGFDSLSSKYERHPCRIFFDRKNEHNYCSKRVYCEFCKIVDNLHHQS